MHVHGRIQSYNRREGASDHSCEIQGASGNRICSYKRFGWLPFYFIPVDEWKAFEQKLRALPLTNKNARTFSRFFVAGAAMCELDRQGEF